MTTKTRPRRLSRSSSPILRTERTTSLIVAMLSLTSSSLAKEWELVSRRWTKSSSFKSVPTAHLLRRRWCTLRPPRPSRHASELPRSCSSRFLTSPRCRTRSCSQSLRKNTLIR